MSLSVIEKKVVESIDKNAEKIIEFGRKVLESPEHGYCEKITSKMVKDEFDSLGIAYRNGMAVTGVKGTLGEGDFNLAIIGELDAVTCFGHDNCNAKSGAAHACGHNAQLAAMMGAAYGLSGSGIMPELGGKVTFLLHRQKNILSWITEKSFEVKEKSSFYRVSSNLYMKENLMMWMRQ